MASQFDPRMKHYKPNTKKWWDLCIQPGSYEFRFLKYCKIDGIAQHCSPVSDYITGSSKVHTIHKFKLFDPNILFTLNQWSPIVSKDLHKEIFLLFYYSEGDNPILK